MTRWLLLGAFLAAAAVLLARTPTADYEASEGRLHAAYAAARGGGGGPRLAVMTFNVRFDVPEQSPDNGFPARLPRIARLLERWAPDVVGLQEPFAPQVRAILEATAAAGAARYGAVGYARPGYHYNGTEGMTAAERRADFQTAILYRTDLFDLVEQDHFWLSEQPRAEGSKDWGSHGVRTATVAVVRPRPPTLGPAVVVINAHIDHACERARRHQAAMVREAAREWQGRWPGAAVVVTGDFNSAPGQAAYRAVTAGGLRDAWVQCGLAEAAGRCARNGVAMTFHGWLGVGVADSYLARAVGPVLFTLHALGLQLPYAVPTSAGGWARAVWGLLSAPAAFPLGESMPAGGGRYHVDWVLHSAALEPQLVAVVDARRGAFSSDHFPVVALLAPAASSE